MLITFSGLDGAGKSTLIERLKEHLEERNRQVAVFHMNYDLGVGACVRCVIRNVVGVCRRRPARGEQHSHAPRPALGQDGKRALVARIRHAVLWNKTFRLCIYPVDLLLFLFCRLYIEKIRGRVLIMDRYFYDTMVDVSGGRKTYGVRLLSRLTPTPSVPVYLDISPEEAYARKGEHSVEYLRGRRSLYRELFPRIPRAVVLATGEDLCITTRALERIVNERLGAR